MSELSVESSVHVKPVTECDKSRRRDFLRASRSVFQLLGRYHPTGCKFVRNGSSDKR